MNNRNKKYQINENIFNNIDSEEKAYFLGFLMADGYNNETRYSVRLCLKEEDVCVLESLKNILYPNNDKPIGYIKRKDGFNLNYLDICNKHISKTLANLGMIQAKTFKLQYPNISNTMNKHFIRGYFDGDGCINFFILKKYKYFKCQFRIIGTENFCKSIQNIINISCNTTGSIRKRENIFELTYSSKPQIIEICNWLYKDSSYFLKRKYNKYIHIKNYKNEKYK